MGLRFLRFPLVLLLIEAVAVTMAAIGLTLGMRWAGLKDEGVSAAIGALILAALLILLWKLLRRYLEGSRDAEFSGPGSGIELGAGLAFGFVLFSSMAGFVWVLGGLEVLGLRGMGAFWSMLAMAIVSGTSEEIVFRGILFRHIETMLGSWGALIITSVLFGAGHLMNPDASPFAAFAIAMEAGILLGAAYMLTRHLWLAIGIHGAWNFTQGWVFSVPVSGGEAPLGLLITSRAGPEWLTGGDFGLEASVVAMIVATLAGLAMLRRAVRKGRVVAPMWRNQTKL